jgi:hypothetical protein
MTSNVGLRTNVGNTILRFTISIDQDKLDQVTLLCKSILVYLAQTLPH